MNAGEYTEPLSAGPVVTANAIHEFVGALYRQLAIHGTITPATWNEAVTHWSDPLNKYANQIRNKLAVPDRRRTR